MSGLSNLNLLNSYNWSEYELLSGDIVVCRFDGRRTVTVDENLCPLCFRDNGGDIEAWLSNRAIDNHRTHSRLLKKFLRVKDRSDVGTVLHCHAVSITDNFWIRKKDEELCWNDVMFNENDYAVLALTGSIMNTSPTSTKSPELTNTGSFEKCWERTETGWRMLKFATQEETYSEFAMCRIGMLLNLDVTDYSLLSPTLISSPDFTKGIYNAQPLYDLIGDRDDVDFVYQYLQSNYGLGSQYLDILLLDALCVNPDRHNNNIEILTSRKDGSLVGLAPNYDFNLSLIATGRPNSKGFSNPMLYEFKMLCEDLGISRNIRNISEQQLREVLRTSVEFPKEFEDDVVMLVLENIRRLKEGSD